MPVTPRIPRNHLSAASGSTDTTNQTFSRMTAPVCTEPNTASSISAASKVWASSEFNYGANWKLENSLLTLLCLLTTDPPLTQLIFPYMPNKALTINCYQCKSSETIECSDVMINMPGGKLQPTSCDHVFEAEYCIKSTSLESKICSSKITNFFILGLFFHFCFNLVLFALFKYLDESGFDKHFSCFAVWKTLFYFFLYRSIFLFRWNRCHPLLLLEGPRKLLRLRAE